MLPADLIALRLISFVEHMGKTSLKNHFFGSIDRNFLMYEDDSNHGLEKYIARIFMPETKKEDNKH